MSHFKTLLLEIKDAAATVTLNRPEIHNAFNEVMIEELTSVFEELSTNDLVRVVVLKGSGESFCAGADLNWMKKMVGYSFEENLADSGKLFTMLKTVYQCSKPVLAYIHGNAIGGGTGLVACADIAFAENTKALFAFSEVRLGLLPAVISPFVLRKIGEANAREYFLTAERFDAATAKNIGLIQHCGSADEMQKLLFEKISALKLGAPQAISASKKLIGDVSGLSFEQAALTTPERIARQRVSDEGQEGMKAFLEKRKPNWRA